MRRPIWSSTPSSSESEHAFATMASSQPFVVLLNIDQENYAEELMLGKSKQ